MYNSQNQTVLPPIPPLRTPIYSGRLQIGALDHLTKTITLYHSPFPFYVMSIRPGSYIQNHLGQRIGRLGYQGQMHRFIQQKH